MTLPILTANSKTFKELSLGVYTPTTVTLEDPRNVIQVHGAKKVKGSSNQRYFSIRYDLNTVTTEGTILSCHMFTNVYFHKNTPVLHIEDMVATQNGLLIPANIDHLAIGGY